MRENCGGNAGETAVENAGEMREKMSEKMREKLRKKCRRKCGDSYDRTLHLRKNENFEQGTNTNCLLTFVNTFSEL